MAARPLINLAPLLLEPKPPTTEPLAITQTNHETAQICKTKINYQKSSYLLSIHPTTMSSPTPLKEKQPNSLPPKLSSTMEATQNEENYQETAPDPNPPSPVLSKRTQKKLLKQQKFEAKKAEKKAQIKEQKHKETDAENCQKVDGEDCKEGNAEPERKKKCIEVSRC